MEREAMQAGQLEGANGHVSMAGLSGAPPRVSPTGMIRTQCADTERYDLIPHRALRRLAEVLAKGAAKYAPHNWRKGDSWSMTANHAIRHLYLFLEGDTSEDHLGHALANVAFLCEYLETPGLAGYDDRFRPPTPPSPSVIDDLQRLRDNLQRLPMARADGTLL